MARSDAWGLLATPLTTIMRASDRVAVAAIAQLVEAEGATHLVVGLPLGEDGTMTEQAHRVHAFGRKLQALPEVAVVFWNERYSTVTAGERLRENQTLRAGQPRRRGLPYRPPPSRYRREQARRREDAAAAAVILQEYLDQQRPEGPPAGESNGGPAGTIPIRGPLTTQGS